MNSTQLAAEYITQLARNYEHMVETAEILTRIGSLENHLKEIEIARDKALGEQADQRALVEQEMETLAHAKAAHADAIIAMQREAMDQRKQLEVRANEILEQARKDADNLLRLAEQDIEAKKVAHEEAMSDLVIERSKLHDEVDVLTAQINSLKSEITVLQTARTEEQDGLDRVRAVIDELAKK